MERLDRLTWRAAGPVLAAAIAGLLFAPVFGLVPLLVPVLVPALTVLAVTILCGVRPSLVDWRPLLASLAGLLAVAETLLSGTTAFGLPTGRTVAALADGTTHSWQLVLESTWPARPEPDLLIFVPLLVVVAAVSGAELRLRLRAAPAALLPSLAVVVLSQFYAVPGPGPAVLAALAYAVAAAVTLATGATLLRLAASGAVSVLIAGLTLILLPDAEPRFSLRDGRPAAVEQSAPANPLDEIAYRLEHPEAEVFRVTDGPGAGLWPLVVLDEFDGVSWNATEEYRRMGTLLPPGPQVTVRATLKRARVTVADTGGPWLPTQTWPASVDGPAPLVIPDYGMLMRQDAPSGPTEYELSWWQPEVDSTTLREAPIDPNAPGALNGVGEPPDSVEELLATAMGDVRASFQGALVLEKYLRDNYHAASGPDRPTGHGWAQLNRFLLITHSGTSEQFAAAYVALARMAGIPARLVVGFRAPAPEDGVVVVRNRDVLAWPEVAVQGVGWVPLDPIASAAGAATGTGLAAEAARARDALPRPKDLVDATIRPVKPAPAPASEGTDLPWAALIAVPLIGWPVGVPALWTVRYWWRRRRTGAAAVLGAWSEVRDRLRAYGVEVTPGMTVRDLSTAAGPVSDDGTTGEIRTLAGIVDQALWSGDQPSDEDVAQSWTSVRVVRRGLARQGWVARVRALLDPRPLLPTGYRWRRGSPWAG
ncbi:transglutaminase domain-containing protein [Actinoplanes sp. NBRC 103695]|uniref:transglutaminase family protein n=1 Tax=Actinoplanes sp. NBRC 103695 TaxID=3032202 RepID=UPI0024A2AAA1|nr:transglutaminase domain-containing protein [Actinoplanes sp. NBRC 103695]GLY97608.1 hypothetical protein Acsp02_48620 [Actinoplanes sp. NBRC 103695]